MLSEETTLIHSALILAILLISLFFVLIPIKLFHLLNDRNRQSLLGERNGEEGCRTTLWISCLSCFAGGTFIAVVFMHLMPDAREYLVTVQQSGRWLTNYPVVELLSLFGFFLLYVIEIISDFCFLQIPHGQELITKHPNILKRRNSTMSTVACEIHGEIHTDYQSLNGVTNPSISSHQTTDAEAERKVVRTVSFICALLFHSAVEGFSFGVQNNVSSIFSLFLGIIVHHAVVSFSVGTRLINCHPNQLRFVVGMALIFALSLPLFATLGLLVQKSVTNLILKAEVSMILVSLSIGTIVYITFFEMLGGSERLHGSGELYKFLCTLFGSLLITAVTFFGS